jgi:hypothetical protein
MSFYRKIAVAFSIALFSVSCSQQAILDKITPRPDDLLARQTIAQLAKPDYPSIVANLDSRLVDQNITSALSQARSALPHGMPSDVKLVGANIRVQNGDSLSQLTYQYSAERQYAVVSIEITRSGKVAKIQTLRVQKIPDALEKLNAFSLKAKPVLSYFILAMAIVVPTFIVITLVQLIRTRPLQLKWLWGLFILLGIGQVNLNWTDGSIAFQPIYFSFLGAGFFRPGLYGPWLLSVALPLGAIVFQIRRRKLKQANGAEK